MLERGLSEAIKTDLLFGELELVAERTALHHLKKPCRVSLLDMMKQHLSMSSLSQALAGEIRREPVHAEGERELAAVVQVMLHHMPDDPGARQVDWFAVPVVGEGVSHLVGTPAGQAIRHALPGAVEGLHHLGGGWDGRPQLQRNLVPTRIHLHL